jgi:hypothetical protein
MARRILVVSPPSQRLTVSLADGAIESAPSESDDYTHVIIEAAGEGGSRPRAPSPPTTGGEPPPPLPIIMSLVGGLPPGVTEDLLAEAHSLAGPLTFRDLARRLAQLPGVGDLLLVLTR